MKLALIGATGLVGQKMTEVLEEFDFPADAFYPAASERSVGKKIVFKGKEYQVCSLKEALAKKPDIVLFSAGAAVSHIWAPQFADVGAYVIDNSSAWRMSPDIPLVVPEVNGHVLSEKTHIIANPNCSTIQMVVALNPLHKNYGIRRLVIATYQSVTGTGVGAVKQMEDERKGIAGKKVYPHPIDMNCFPHGGDFLDNGYSSEEMKLVNETRKILEEPALQITSTVVRIPVKGGHSEAVNVELQKDFEMKELRDLLTSSPGIIVQDDPGNAVYPMPLYTEGKNEVFVGRLRRDLSQPNTLDMWVVADNLRKGAATNAVQIALLMMKKIKKT
ncbi:MAG: aspartate-semialdehyde dehydrogenase [Bacteroidales bacterium]